MSDEELVAICKRTPREESLHESGCVVGLVLGLIVMVAVIVCKVFGLLDWLHWIITVGIALYLGFSIPLIVYGLFEWLAAHRAKPYLGELKHRYCTPMETETEEVEGWLEQDATVCVFVGHGLPHGGSYGVRVVFFDDTRLPTIECCYVERGFDFCRGHHPATGVSLQNAELPRDRAKTIRGLVDETIGTGKVVIPKQVIDGFPAHVTILRKGIPPTRISCNLHSPISREERRSPHWTTAHWGIVEEMFVAGKEMMGW